MHLSMYLEAYDDKHMMAFISTISLGLGLELGVDGPTSVRDVACRSVAECGGG